MSIENEIDRITTAKQDIKSAIEAKGVSVPEEAHIDEYSQYIDNLVNPENVVTSVNGEHGDVTIDAESLGLADVAKSGSYNDLIDVPTQKSISVEGDGDAITDIQETDAGIIATKGGFFTTKEAFNLLSGTVDNLAADVTYYRTGNNPLADNGGISTQYTIPISEITPEFPKPFNYSTIIFCTDSFAYIGTITDVSDDSVTAEVKAVISGTGGTDTYDTIIGSQEDFEAWYKELDEGTYTGKSVLFMAGTYTRDDGHGLHLPDTLKQLHGLGTVKINITGFVYNANTNKGGIWYTTTPTTKEYSIENISLSCTGTNYGSGSDYGYGFYSCTNLINCTGTGTGAGMSSGYGCGFHTCTNLTNCTGTGTGTVSVGYSYGYGFYSCTNLINCTGTGTAQTCYGFYSCTNLINCTGTGTGTRHGSGFHTCTNLINCTGTGTGETWGTSGYGYGFYSCTNLSNCTGTGSVRHGSGANPDYGYGFHTCKICSNCRQDPDNESTTATWGGTNTNIDPDTCPDYEDTEAPEALPDPAGNDGKVLGVVDGKLAYVDRVSIVEESNEAGGTTYNISF